MILPVALATAAVDPGRAVSAPPVYRIDHVVDKPRSGMTMTKPAGDPLAECSTGGLCQRNPLGAGPR